MEISVSDILTCRWSVFFLVFWGGRRWGTLSVVLNWKFLLSCIEWITSCHHFSENNCIFYFLLVIQIGSWQNVFNVFFFPIDDTAMLWGIKFYNDFLMQAGPLGNVQSEVLFQKDATFTFDKGWAFPRRVYFNGDNCVMPPPDAYPWLPNASSQQHISLLTIVMTFLSTLTFMFAYA